MGAALNIQQSQDGNTGTINPFIICELCMNIQLW